MEGLEVTVLLGLTILTGALLAPRVRLALPLVLVVLGLLLGFVPALREIQLPPETVLLLFLPVMLFWESLTTSLRSIRRDFRYILPMSTLLVVASAFAVAGIGLLFGLPPDSEECPACARELHTPPSAWVLLRLWRFAHPYRHQQQRVSQSRQAGEGARGLGLDVHKRAPMAACGRSP